MRRVIAVIQARMGSTRLPGKALRLIHGKTMVQVHAERLGYCQSIDGIALATTVNQSDDVLVQHCKHLPSWTVGTIVRGSEERIDERMLQATKDTDADAIVRITADSPLVDPALVDALVMGWKNWVGPALDYASNVFPNRTYPDGLDVEILSREYLQRSVSADWATWDHEALTTNVWKNPRAISISGTWVPHAFRWITLGDVEPSLGDLRWTVDRPDDLYFVRWVYDQLPSGFGWRDVLALRNEWARHLRGYGYREYVDLCQPGADRAIEALVEVRYGK